MIRKLLLTISATLFLLTSIHAQNGEIKGKVSDQEGKAIAFANIELQGTTKGSQSDENGIFRLDNLNPGEYTLVVSFIGYKDQIREVSLSANQTKTLEFVLAEEDLQLQTVEIIGREERDYDNEISFIGTKTATRLKDLPQAVSYVTKEVMEDRQAYRVNDVVKNISGINQFSWYNDYTIRGFRSQQELINGLRVIGLFGPQILVANLERVEVIKGPASAVFGNSSPGGTMNRVTKKPLFNERKALTFTTGSFNTLRTTMDFTGPLNESKTLLYRLNLAYENSDDFRDLQEFKSLMVAPSISFLPTPKTRINFDLVFTNFDGKLDRGQPIFGASAGTDLNSTPISFAIGAANDYHRTDVAFSTLSLSHQFSPNFSFNSSYMRYKYQEDLFEHRTSNRFAVDAEGQQIPTLMGMRISAREQKRITDNLSAYFALDGFTGEVSHKLVFGYDYVQSVRPVGGGSIFTSSGAIYRTIDGGLSTYDPANRDNFIFENGNPKPNIPHFNLEDPTYTIGFPSDYILGRLELSASKFFTQGIYVQDQMKLGPLQLLLGVRQEFYTDISDFNQPGEETTEQSKFLPRIGLVYSLTRDINLYGTYTESFQPQNPSLLVEAVGGPFDPLTGTMYEFGAKGDFFNNRLSATLAVYFIENKNILINDITTGLLAQRGAEQSQGFEVDINGKIGNNFSITANYAYNDATITESDDETEIGLTKENAPKHAGGLFANYFIDTGLLQGLNFNVGTNFVTERNTFERALVLPGYNVWDVGASYRVNKVKLALTFNNIFDKTHWAGGYSFVRLFPGAPRNYVLSISYTF
ncbi:MAG: TonB-dependent receptor [Bacteroidota bacterium]